MRSNIHDVLKMVEGVVHACGPLEWDKGEANAVAAVTVSQDGIVGVSCSPPNFGVSEKTWRLTVAPAIPGKEFTKGTARATLHVCAAGDGIVTSIYPCDKDIQLEE
ncbi:MAG TPA: hypothetical protein VF081_07990 [Solirubrobacterales bacterium]